LAQKIDTGEIFAMKTLKKTEMFKRDQVRKKAHSLISQRKKQQQ